MERNLYLYLKRKPKDDGYPGFKAERTGICQEG